jgi:hypothetical protein
MKMMRDGGCSEGDDRCGVEWGGMGSGAGLRANDGDPQACLGEVPQWRDEDGSGVPTGSGPDARGACRGSDWVGGFR